MQIITDADFRRALKGDISGGFLFFGDEDYLKLHALRSAREAVCPDPSLEIFNDIRIDGSEFDPAALANALPTLPVMADKKLIEVTGLDMSGVKKTDADALFEILEEAADYDFNIIVISAISGGIDEGYLPKRPSKMLNAFGKYLTPVHFPRSTPAMLTKWVARHFAHNGIEADTGLCSALIDYCGKDMFILANETDKLSWYLHSAGRTRLESADVGRVCIPDTGYDTFAFANAVSARRRAEALNILAEMQRRRIEPTLVMGEITATFCNMLSARMLADDGLSPADIGKKLGNMHEYKVKLMLGCGLGVDKLRALLELCAEADRALKNSSSAGYIPIERLICSF